MISFLLINVTPKPYADLFDLVIRQSQLQEHRGTWCAERSSNICVLSCVHTDHWHQRKRWRFRLIFDARNYTNIDAWCKWCDCNQKIPSRLQSMLTFGVNRPLLGWRIPVQGLRHKGHGRVRWMRFHGVSSHFIIGNTSATLPLCIRN